MHIFLVDDGLQRASFILKGLKEAGFAVAPAADAQLGLDLALIEPIWDDQSGIAREV